MDLLTGLYQGFFLQRLRFTRRCIQHLFRILCDLLRFFLCRTDPGFCDTLAQQVADPRTADSRYDTTENDVE